MTQIVLFQLHTRLIKQRWFIRFQVSRQQSSGKMKWLPAKLPQGRVSYVGPRELHFFNGKWHYPLHFRWCKNATLRGAGKAPRLCSAWWKIIILHASVTGFSSSVALVELHKLSFPVPTSSQWVWGGRHPHPDFTPRESESRIALANIWFVL